MWWLEYLRSGLTLEYPAAAIGLFRIAFALSLILKTAVEIRRGYYAYFDEGSYLYALHRKLNPKPWLKPWMYRLQFAVRIPVAIMLLLGVGPVPALAVLALCLAVELRIYFKYHANLMFLLALILLASPAPLDVFGLPSLARFDWDWRAAFRADLARSADPISQVLVALTLCVVYWATAFRKMNSQFLSGEVVRSHLAFAREQRPSRRHADYWLPDFLARTIIADAPGTNALLRLSMACTVALELGLPFALLSPGGFRLAALCGILMHTAFTALYPGTLLHFSLLSVASYLCFAPPRAVLEALLVLSH